ncbi:MULTISPECIES: hypothetical protein [unclassified Novosphingobium]|uniref:hypothetical protein n=1 Tax=unclassified Novosphingobium TaxID=2644732 RepID=UPI00146E6C8E|nr:MULTISPECIES: hypothetical protein [unclassified Novosphingobium]NMN06911.1 hypothetical protein [Novosphingobium sp. SG919]NMN89502.1 hypothetical protein [Novosphingobium sp. SG916]
MTKHRWAQAAFSLAILAGTAACDKLTPGADGAVAATGAAGSLDADPSDGATPDVFTTGTPDDPVTFLKAMFADDGIAGSVSTVGDLRHRYFSEELSGMLSDTLRGGDTVALTANPLCLCNNPSKLRQAIILQHADARHAVARVTVTRYGVSDGPTAHLVITMTKDVEGWKVTDVLYPDEKESLRSILAKANAPQLDENAAV